MSSSAIHKPTLDELTKFGITPADDGLHDFNPADTSWQESYFFDWYNAEGTLAGHCRLGLLAGQARLWLWLFLFDGEAWTALEEAHLPLSIFDRESLSIDWLDLAFEYTITDPLLAGRLSVSGFGRVLNGPSAGMILPMEVTLELQATSAAHSIGQNTVQGHADENYSTSRYEQAISCNVRQQVGNEVQTFQAKGERDHSWGPRAWNINWHFLVANAADFRFQSTIVNIEGLPEIKLGYLSRTDTTNLVDVAYDLTYHDENPFQSVEGRYRLDVEDGTSLQGKIVPISGCEINIAHSLQPPQQSIYRRTLVRCVPDDGSESFIGWLEIHRMIPAGDSG